MMIAILITLAVVKAVCMQHSQCINPQNYRGQCVPIQLCDYLVNIVRTNQSPEARNFLSKSQCGYNGYTTFVCCPQTTQLQPKPNQNSQPTRAPVSMQKLILRPQTVAQSLLPKPPACGVDVEDRIFGGAQTTIDEFPWFALLKYSRPGSTVPIFSCSGTLISDRYVVTAAHCVHSTILQRTRLVSVRLGEWNVLTNPDCDDSSIDEKVCNHPYVDVGIESLDIHERYLPQSRNQYNDIALIRMSQRINFNDFIKPICLDLEPQGSLIGQSVVVAGFGKTETAFSSNIKLKVTLDIVDNEKCNQVFRVEGRRLDETQLCAGGKKNVDSCRGDSGGPMMRFITRNRVPVWILYGIVSYGSSPCGQENKPAVYTSMPRFISWIESKMRP